MDPAQAHVGYECDGIDGFPLGTYERDPEQRRVPDLDEPINNKARTNVPGFFMLPPLLLHLVPRNLIFR
ncbi:hypothetical protein D3C87_2077830 [compost metagenome]